MFITAKNIVFYIWMSGILNLLYSEFILAQCKSAQFEHLIFEKGVPHNYIYTIYQDQYGFMWFGTLYGLVKYDGKQYKEYIHDPEDSLSISSDEVVTIFEDSRGYIWIGTIEGGLNRLDRQTGKFTRYLNIPKDTSTISNNTVWSIQEDENNNIWIGTSNGLNLIESNVINESSKTSFKRFLYNKNVIDNSNNKFIRSVLIDKKGRIWISVFGQGLYYFEKENSRIIQISLLPKNIVYIFEDNSQTLWLATWGQGLKKVIIEDESNINKETVKFIEYQKGPGGPISNYTWTLEEDRFGNLWIGTDQGLNKFDRNKNAFILYRHSQSDLRSLSSNQIASLYEDKSGVIWIGAFQGGIDKFIPYTEKFVHIKNNPFNPNSLSFNNVGAVYEDLNGILWIGTLGGGLNKYNIEKSEFLKFTFSANNENSLSSNYVTSICNDNKGNRWIGTYNGLNYFDKDGYIHRFQSILEDSNKVNNLLINTIKTDRFDNLWVGTNKHGLIRIENENLNNKINVRRYKYDPLNSNSISHDNVLTILEDSYGQIWVGTYNGLNKLVFTENDSNREVKQFVSYKYEKHNSTSISNNNIYCIYEDRNRNLWIGTSIGLNRFHQKNESFTHFTVKNGLPNNVVNGILEDSRGNLWLSTNKGLSKFDTKNRVFTNYDAQDGLQSNVFGINTNCVLKTGELVFGGINGVNIFDPNNIKQNNYIPPIVLTDFKTYGEGISSIMHLMNSEKIELGYEDKFFTVEFAALDYTNPEKNQYAYKLEGFDDEWIYCGNKNFADYTNISPGTYIFKVIGSNNDGIWNEQGTSIEITILPPFWQTLWFRIFLLIVFFLLIYLLIHVIKKQEKRKSEIKEQIIELRMQALRSKMNPHFIFNTINSIQYFLSCNEQKSAMNYLSKFAKLMRKTLELSDNPNISIAEELEAVKLYLDLEKLRFENQFDYKITVDPVLNIKEYRIPNMIIQPYVENAVKHGIKVENKNGLIKINLEKTNKGIKYSIEDNGIGFKKSQVNNQNIKDQNLSSGMDITRSRLILLGANQNINNDIEVVDLNDESPDKTGTRVTISIPILNIN